MGLTIGILGGSISGNKGAEAMLTTVVRSLKQRFPEARFAIFSPYARADKPLEARYPDAQVVDGGPFALVAKYFPCALLARLLRPLGLRVRGPFRETRSLARCDLVVDVAGIAFSDGREKYLPFNVLTILTALWMGVDVAKLSQALGPFGHRLNRALARWLLPRCRILVARGQSTAENLRTIGLDHVPVCPDVAFALNDVEDMRSLDPGLARHLEFGTASRRLVGICPSSVVYQGCEALGVDYVGIHARFAQHLLERGYRVLVLPHSQRPGSTSLKNNDLPVVRALMERLGESPEAAMVAEELDSVALRKLIGRCEFFLASRFHSMVASLAMGVPTMVCGWGHKYFELLDPFGLREYAFDYRELALDHMVGTFERLVAEEPNVRAAIARALPEVMAQARWQIDAVAALLRGGIAAGAEPGPSAPVVPSESEETRARP